MGVKVATTGLQWSQPTQTLASAISSPASIRRSFGSYVHNLAFLGAHPCSNRLHKTRSCEQSKNRGPTTIRRAISATLDDSFSDEEFSEKLKDLAMRFQLSDDNGVGNSTRFESEQEIVADYSNVLENQRPSFDPVEPPDWPERGYEVIPASIERKANSVDLPLSLRIIKRKKQWRKEIEEAGGSAYCSVKKAFSSMVFIIRELQSYTLQMREVLFYEDLQGILGRVEKEMHASFVWLFQQVFSHTPTLMVYVMILLANYSVHSMANSAAIAAAPPTQAYAATVESISTLEDKTHGGRQRFDSSVMKSFSVSSSTGKSTSVGGGSGGGGKYRPVASGSDGDGPVSFDHHRTFVPDGISSLGNATRSSEEESVSGQVSREEEINLWSSIVDEASKMQAASRDEALDHETMQRFVSPVDAKIEADDYEDYFRTELLYQTGLAQEPNSSLLLANYAQFLYLVAQDYDRAEDYFKKAAAVEPKDAEALNKYATFLWKARNNLWAAEETYLEAIAAEPSNSCYSANYAHFLWNTGGEDTCFPLSSPEAEADL